jgi:NADPH2:quinone reductase
MKAAVIFENGPPDVLRYEDVADPVCPDGCVLLDVEAISIEGGDLLARPRRRRAPRTSSAICAPARSSRSAPESRAPRSARRWWP